MSEWSRRHVLRGMLGGAAVSVGLPGLASLLPRAARAQEGAFPLRFGTWTWGCGMNPHRWVPAATGSDVTLPVELAALAPWQDRVAVLSGFDAKLDGLPNWPHHSGVSALRTGVAPARDVEAVGTSLDVAIAEAVGRSTPFRSLDLSATGRRSDSYSWVRDGVVNPSEVSPIALYERLFGLTPPTGGDGPDPRMVLRQSVLSVVGEDIARVNRTLGRADRERLDLYLTNVRQLEQQLAQLADPPDLAACTTPEAPTVTSTGTTVRETDRTHRALVELLVMALACDRTRVFNLVYSWGLSALRQEGENTDHHQLTHDELVDETLGHQPRSTAFVLSSMDALAHLIERLASVPEGEGTLLDHCIVLAHSETSFAKTHDVSGLPMIVAGGGNGRIRTGQHVAGNGDPVTRVGLTLQQAMGLTAQRWGTGSMTTDRPVGALLA